MKEKIKNKYLDIKKIAENNPKGIDFLCFKDNKNVSKSLLFSKGKIVNSFFTEDSKLYISPRRKQLIEQGLIFDFGVKKWDSLASRIVLNYALKNKSSETLLLQKLRKRYTLFQENLQNASDSLFGKLSLVRLWNLSIVGAILFGMFSMSMVYKYLGQGAAAGIALDTISNNINNERMVTESSNKKVVLGVEIIKEDYINTDIENINLSPEEEENIKSLAEMDSEVFKERAKILVKGYPIEKMLPYILEKDRKVAAFLIGIAKKESSWGEHVPVLDGQDCYNYWGYRGQRKLMGTGGHTCFNSRKDAVDTVAKRIATLVNDNGKDTPEKMILWKCGSGCSGTADEKKWISDVEMYYKKLDS
jgi:hypothetical protein